MTTNITTLALNLLIAERLSHRNFLATKIIDQLNALGDYSSATLDVQHAFISLLHQCIANPNCKFRDAFYQSVEEYSKKIESRRSLPSAA